MFRKLIIIFTLILVFQISSFTQSDSQEENHSWKTLQIDNEQKVWYDLNSISTNENIISVWLLELHNPFISIESIKGKIYRSKTLYNINFEKLKYGIEKVVYYDVSNKELYRYDYKLANYDKEYRYTFPVMENSIISIFLEEYIKIYK